jgi:hypothetical protein
MWAMAYKLYKEETGWDICKITDVHDRPKRDCSRSLAITVAINTNDFEDWINLEFKEHDRLCAEQDKEDRK